MASRAITPFQHIESTAPGFIVTSSSSNSFAYALQSTGLREWSGPHSRSVRMASQGAADHYIAFGSTLAVANSTDGMLVLGQTVEIFTPIRPGVTHIAVIGSSTSADLNITLGYGA